MGFQDSAFSLRSRLHLGKVGPAALAGAIVVGALVLVCAAFGMVQATPSHEFEVVKAQDASDADAARLEGSASDDVRDGAAEALIYVHVSGCVATPGVYALAEGARVTDAVEAAGGFAEGASEGSLNLARLLNDGEQVAVPSVEEAASAAVGASAAAGSASAAIGSSTTTRVNINTASAAELQTLDGIGEVTARKIVSDREANGPFATVEDIKRVSGIGDKKFENLKDFICVG
ncbi:MAG: ComEA family DNA-binding protein [Eggerthellaceae bacterium]|nr:ComEA family DNA-binding protein [Eggerthellaceae bacterium]